MDFSFSEGKDKFLVIYLDDIIVYYDFDEKHLKHLEQVFQKSRSYGVSLNPKKSNFSMKEGKLLGHVISKEGIKIDPSRVTSIIKIDIPRSKRKFNHF